MKSSVVLKETQMVERKGYVSVEWSASWMAV